VLHFGLARLLQTLWVMLRTLGLAVAFLCLSRVAAAEAQLAAGSEDDTAWSEKHTVKVRRPRLEPPMQRSSVTGDRVALLVHLGIGAPAGALGVDLDIAPVSFFAVGLGAGRSPGSWQFAATPRFRFRSAQSTFLTLGSGVSFGAYNNGHTMAGVGCALACIMEGMGDSSGDIATQHYDRALWYNLELGADIYAREGSGLLRLTFGYGLILNSNDYSCSENPKAYYATGHGCSRDSGQALVFIALAGGFDL
jgi:hypothetical protein